MDISDVWRTFGYRIFSARVVQMPEAGTTLFVGTRKDTSSAGGWRLPFTVEADGSIAGR